VSDLPIGWTTATISDVTKYLSRGKQPKYVSYSSLPVINQRAIRWNGIQNEHLKYVDPMQFDLWEPERFIQAGDILWNSTGTGTLGRAYLVTEQDLKPPKVVDSHVTILRPNQTAIDPRFLFFWIQSSEVQENIASLATGATNQIELGRAVIASMCISFAPLNEQKRITDKLDSLLARVDACRDRLNCVPKLLKYFRQSILIDAISGQLTLDWRNGEDITDSWLYERAEDICDKVQSGGTPKEGFINELGIPFLKIYNIVDQKIDFEYRPQFVSELVHKKTLARSCVKPGDVLMNIVGPPLGKVAIVPNLFPEWNINQAITFFRPNERIITGWLYYFLCSGNSIAKIIHETRGSAGQSNISLSQCRNFLFPVPPVEEQQEIVRRVNELFAYADLIETRYQNTLSKVNNLVSAILNKAFRGELVPQDPNGEPASILLERIRAERIANLTTQKKQIAVRRPQMSKMSSEAVKKEIFNLPNDKFSFDELHNHLHKQLLGDYDALKEILFTLLDEPESSIAQIFDSEVEEICFTRRQK